MHAQFFHQLALAGDAVQVANQQDAQQKFGINGRSPRVAVAVLQSLADEGEADVLIDEPQQVVLRNVIVEFEVIEQRFGTGVLPHHDQQASASEDHAIHGTNASLYRALPAYQSDFFNTHRPYRNRSGPEPITYQMGILQQLSQEG
jgi:hypothetical protein